jgi:hypothetical protein
MTMRLRKLNDEGVQQFSDWLTAGAPGDAPLSLLESPETSEPIADTIVTGTGVFEDRYEFGVYLKSLLGRLDPAVISGDRNLWTSLGLVWFNRICPQRADGTRDVKEHYRYILSNDYRHYYRHLIRSPWYLVRQHGENARFLLIAPQQKDNPLSVHGEILEQVGGRQQVLASRPIISAACRMYLDPATGRPRKGVAGSSRGSARRFGMVLRQLDLTYDAEVMTEDGLIAILPGEFDIWRKRMLASAAPSKIESAVQQMTV